MSLEIRARAGESSPECPYCHDEVGEPVACPDCRAGLHAECWAELESCPTLGCSGRPAESAAPASRPTGGAVDPSRACAACHGPASAKDSETCEGCGFRVHAGCRTADGSCPTASCLGLRENGALWTLAAIVTACGMHGLVVTPLIGALLEGWTSDGARAAIATGASLLVLPLLLVFARPGTLLGLRRLVWQNPVTLLGLVLPLGLTFNVHFAIVSLYTDERDEMGRMVLALMIAQLILCLAIAIWRCPPETEPAA